MVNLVLVSQAERETGYSSGHIRYLLGEGLINGRKEGGIWLVDLNDLLRHKRQMDRLGSQKYDPTRGKAKS